MNVVTTINLYHCWWVYFWAFHGRLNHHFLTVDGARPSKTWWWYYSNLTAGRSQTWDLRPWGPCSSHSCGIPNGNMKRCFRGLTVTNFDGKISNANVTWPWHMWPKHWEFILASRLFQRWTTGFFGAAATFKEHNLNLHEEPKMGPTHTTPNMAIWAPEIGGLKHQQKSTMALWGTFKHTQFYHLDEVQAECRLVCSKIQLTRQRWYIYICQPISHLQSHRRKLQIYVQYIYIYTQYIHLYIHLYIYVYIYILYCISTFNSYPDISRWGRFHIFSVAYWYRRETPLNRGLAWPVFAHEKWIEVLGLSNKNSNKHRDPTTVKCDENGKK